MNSFEIVAHRGVASEYPENTIPAFQRAIELGTDAVELDVQLTKDKIPVVYHYYYLEKKTSLPGPIFNYTYQQLSQAKYLNAQTASDSQKIPTLLEVLEAFGGRIGLEIEIKGPGTESTIIIGDILRKFQNMWGTIEVTSYEITMLTSRRNRCPCITTDLLYPRSEPRMNLDVVAYQAATWREWPESEQCIYTQANSLTMVLNIFAGLELKSMPRMSIMSAASRKL